MLLAAMLRRPRNPRPARFRRPRRARARMLTWWVMWRVPVLLLVVLAGWWYGLRPIVAEQGWIGERLDFAICGARSSGADGCVVDGDTLIIGFGEKRRRVRLTGYNAPELNGACEAERKLAVQSRAALHEWLAQGPFEWDGADNPPRDQYGRELRAARRVGSAGKREFLAETMIERGLAAESGWGGAPARWCD